MKLSQAKTLLLQAISLETGLTMAKSSDIELTLIQQVKHNLLTPTQASKIWVNGYNTMCNNAFNKESL